MRNESVKEKKYRLKEKDRKVLRILKESENPLGANEWFRKVKEREIYSRNTFYKSKEKLVGMGMVEIKEKGQKKLHYISDIWKNVEKELKELEKIKRKFTTTLMSAEGHFGAMRDQEKEPYLFTPKKVLDELFKSHSQILTKIMLLFSSIPKEHEGILKRILSKSLRTYRSIWIEYENFLDKNPKWGGQTKGVLKEVEEIKSTVEGWDQLDKVMKEKVGKDWGNYVYLLNLMKNRSKIKRRFLGEKK